MRTPAPSLGAGELRDPQPSGAAMCGLLRSEGREQTPCPEYEVEAFSMRGKGTLAAPPVQGQVRVKVQEQDKI